MSTAPATAESVAEILQSVDDKPASYLAAARRLAATARDALVPVRMGVLSSFTFELVTPYVTVEAARRGLDLQLVVAPYGQLEQQLLDPRSMLYAGAPAIITIATRVEDIAPELADGFMSLDPGAIEAALDAYVRRVENLARAAREHCDAKLLVLDQPPLQRIAAGLADPSLELSQQRMIAELNHRLSRVCAAIPGTTIVDVHRLATEIGVSQWFDRRLQFMARSPLGAVAQRELGRRLARYARALSKPACKCLVLDLDNTLWGGVLGEEGIGGISLGEEYPGSVFKAFQRAVRSYRDRGILLAIASKNNEADVVELFAGHADMVLRLEDFAARQVHWNDKASSLRAIAETLNIGIDSLAFFDDNPVERAWVREQLPEVTVIEVPKDPLRYVDALDESGAFDQLVITAEDRKRAQLYQNEIRRRDLERTATSLDEFLRALDMKVTLGTIDERSLPRVVQLLGKTNQFNVTTRRHSEVELLHMLGRGAIGLWMRIADKYGDNGLVGVAIAMPEQEGVFRIDSFLMSCRVLGRTAEHALLHGLARRARAAGARTLVGEFIPTKKNQPAATFFADAGFQPIPDRAGWWQIDIDGLPALPGLYDIVEEP